MAGLVLVNPWVEGISNNKPPLGLGYLVAYLKARLGYDQVRVVNTGSRVLERIAELQPELVGFTAYSANFPEVMALSEKVKRDMGIPVLLGGPHVTALPESLPRWVDVGVIGEGEETLLDLMRLFLDRRALPPSRLCEIPGLAFWDGDRLVRTSARPPIVPLDNIPPPDREALDIERYLAPSQILMNNEYVRGTTILTSRGCPFRCVYCHVSAKWGRVRYHSPGRVADEIAMLVHTYRVEGIYIADDLFSANLHRVRAITRGLRERGVLGKVRFFLDLRANLVSEPLMEALKEMGVVRVSLGLESGSERILRYLKGGDVTVEDGRRAVRIANRLGIGCHCCFMLGSPGETVEDIRLTQNLIREILELSPQNFCQVNVTTPLPGTPLWDYARQRGLIPHEIDWRQYSLDPTLASAPDFYVNEVIPFSEFRRLVDETFHLANSRRFESILRRLSWRYVTHAIRRPRLALQIVGDWLRFRALSKASGEALDRSPQAY
ncbi:MAG: B12-binding domain-containing radical SAM protein [candidate division KSB1 bacterium]|nr:B12-binding domain-containing radical SAM protein [candidate division KSB1 bacterium]